MFNHNYYYTICFSMKIMMIITLKISREGQAKTFSHDCYFINQFLNVTYDDIYTQNPWSRSSSSVQPRPAERRCPCREGWGSLCCCTAQCTCCRGHDRLWSRLHTVKQPPCWLSGKESTARAADLGLIPAFAI